LLNATRAASGLYLSLVYLGINPSSSSSRRVPYLNSIAFSAFDKQLPTFQRKKEKAAHLVSSALQVAETLFLPSKLPLTVLIAYFQQMNRYHSDISPSLDSFPS
jgi:hypothetical protein